MELLNKNQTLQIPAILAFQRLRGSNGEQIQAAQIAFRTGLLPLPNGSVPRSAAYNARMCTGLEKVDLCQPGQVGTACWRGWWEERCDRGVFGWGRPGRERWDQHRRGMRLAAAMQARS